MALVFSSNAKAAYNFYYKLSSLSQDVEYLQTTLDEILQPAGWALIPETVNVGDSIGGDGMGQRSGAGLISYPQLGANVQNVDYALRVVRFSATARSGGVASGWIYLVIARTDKSGIANVRLSKQAKRGFTETWHRDLWHSLSLDENPVSFALEVRAQDLHLVEGLTVRSSELPKWAVPRPYFPKATSAQIVSYARTKISQQLKPMGFSLEQNIIDLNEDVVVATGAGFPPALRMVESEHLTLRSLSFRTRDASGKVFTGGITLVISRPGDVTIRANQSLVALKDPAGRPLCDLFLAANVDAGSFPLEVRFENLRLAPVFVRDDDAVGVKF